MADKITKVQRSYTMAQIRAKGTQPELRLGAILQEVFPGLELVHGAQDLPGKPDWWIPSIRLAVFADGCFFHGCPRHCRLPDTNRDYWEGKIEGNKARDKRVNRELKALGVRAVRIWEHAIRRDISSVKRKLRRATRGHKPMLGSS